MIPAFALCRALLRLPPLVHPKGKKRATSIPSNGRFAATIAWISVDPVIMDVRPAQSEGATFATDEIGDQFRASFVA